jgi:hypothetical protein
VFKFPENIDFLQKGICDLDKGFCWDLLDCQEGFVVAFALGIKA